MSSTDGPPTSTPPSGAAPSADPGRATPSRATPSGGAPGGLFADVSEEFVAFWTERRICLLATTAPDGTPHVVAVGATLDRDTGIARVIARGGSKKIRNVLAHGDGGARVAVSANEGAKWSTLQGTGVVHTDRASVSDAEERYARRYRVPTPNPERVVLEIAVDHVLGSVR